MSRPKKKARGASSRRSTKKSTPRKARTAKKAVARKPAKRAAARKPVKKPAPRKPAKKIAKAKVERAKTKTRLRAVPTTSGFHSAAAPEFLVEAAQPFTLDIVSFNTHGAVDKTGQVQNAVSPYLRANKPDIACFQELFFEGERLQLDAQLLGPNVVREVLGDIEIARSNDGLFSTRIGTTPTGPFGGAGAGIAIYTSLLAENPRFVRFDSLAFPDSLAVKGVVGVDIITEDSSFVVATTHFNDNENDEVDGRARSANIDALGDFLADAIGRPVIIVGDFNLNAAAAVGEVDAVLFNKLNFMGGRTWLEVGLENMRQNGLGRPVPTLVGGQRSIDFMFASGVDGAMPSLSADTYLARDAFASDHRLIRATLEFA